MAREKKAASVVLSNVVVTPDMEHISFRAKCTCNITKADTYEINDISTLIKGTKVNISELLTAYIQRYVIVRKIQDKQRNSDMSEAQIKAAMEKGFNYEDLMAKTRTAALPKTAEELSTLAIDKCTSDAELDALIAKAMQAKAAKAEAQAVAEATAKAEQKRQNEATSKAKRKK